jgi:hypothetical protein
VAKLRLLEALLQMQLMPWQLTLQVRQDEQALQHLRDEFFRQCLFP